MLYERKVKYLDYYEDGERIRGGGFVKLEVRDGSLRMEAAVTGLHPTDTFARDVELCGRSRERIVGRIEIAGGKGQYRQQWRNLEDIGGTGIRYKELQGIRIPLGTGREISCKWKVPEQTDGGKAVQASPVKEEIEEKEESDQAGSLRRWIAEERAAAKSPGEEMTAMEAGQKKEEEADDLPKRDSPKENPVRLMEDKWQQLWAIYPHIRPFQDQREYLSIGPADFVLFPTDSYQIVNNSFLLHGYYNYRHLILARVERKGDYSYYIGVPGNFFEREKQVAIMFGFESFECAEEPAQAGDFGYYMMRTEL